MYPSTLQEKIEYICDRHDIVCNQKYNENLPYSFHLHCVGGFIKKYKYVLLSREDILHGRTEYFDDALVAGYGHDIIEDANLTWNDCVKLFGEVAANAIFACTELRGKNRAERHGPEYIAGLKADKLGLFVKLCDIMANVTFGIATQSTMVSKYKKEFVHFKEALYTPEYKDLFDYLDLIYSTVK